MEPDYLAIVRARYARAKREYNARVRQRLARLKSYDETAAAASATPSRVDDAEFHQQCAQQELRAQAIVAAMGAHERAYTIHRGIMPCEQNVLEFFCKFANPKSSYSRPIKNAFRSGTIDTVRYMREFVPTDLDYDLNEWFEAISSWFKVAYNADCSAWSLLWNDQAKESFVQLPHRDFFLSDIDQALSPQPQPTTHHRLRKRRKGIAPSQSTTASAPQTGGSNSTAHSFAVLLAIEDGVNLLLWPLDRPIDQRAGAVAENLLGFELITLNRGDVIVWRDDVTHAGGYYAPSSGKHPTAARLHCYLQRGTKRRSGYNEWHEHLTEEQVLEINGEARRRLQQL